MNLKKAVFLISSVIFISLILSFFGAAQPAINEISKKDNDLNKITGMATEEGEEDNNGDEEDDDDSSMYEGIGGTLLVVLGSYLLYKAYASTETSLWLIGQGQACYAGSSWATLGLTSWTCAAYILAGAAMLIIGIYLITKAMDLFGGDEDDDDEGTADTQEDGSDSEEDSESVKSDLDAQTEQNSVACEESGVTPSFSRREILTGWEYTLTYTIASCDSFTEFSLELIGDGVKQVGTGTVQEGQVFSETRVVVDEKIYTKGCVVANGVPHCAEES